MIISGRHSLILNKRYLASSPPKFLASTATETPTASNSRTHPFLLNPVTALFYLQTSPKPNLFLFLYRRAWGQRLNSAADSRLFRSLTSKNTLTYNSLGFGLRILQYYELTSHDILPLQIPLDFMALTKYLYPQTSSVHRANSVNFSRNYQKKESYGRVFPQQITILALKHGLQSC